MSEQKSAMWEDANVLENVREKLRERFDERGNYREVMRRVEASEKKPRRWLKYALAPACLVVAIGVALMMQERPATESIVPAVATSENEIHINRIGDLAQGAFRADADIQTKTDAEIRGEIAAHDFLDRLRLPAGLERVNSYAVYVRENHYSMVEWSPAKNPDEYTVLHEYRVNYEQRLADDSVRSISLAWSPDYTPFRDYMLADDTPLVSKINGVEVVITAYEDSLQNLMLATFSYDGMSFDIESSGVSEKEFIDFLESLLAS